MNPELQLRPYQAEGVQVLTAAGRHLLADTMGLGKTITTLKSVEKLNGTPCLIVGTKNSLGVWEEEIADWLGERSVIYSGPPKKRQKAWEHFTKDNVPFLITNYAFVKEILAKKAKWHTIVADEIHLGGLLNHKTQTYKNFYKLKSTHLFLVTGSPIRKNPADLYAPFRLIQPKKFTSYWRFVHQHCLVIDDMFGKTIEARPKDPKKFRAFVRQYMLRRTKSEVLDDLPEKIRARWPLEMTPKQAKLYNQLAEEMIAESDGELIVVPNHMARDVKLRQLLVSPRLLGFDEEGAAIPALKEAVQNEFAEGNSVAIFTPFRAAVDLLLYELSEYANRIEVVKGGLSAEEVSLRARRFQAEPDHKKIFIGTIKSGTSFTIHQASAAYFIGYEWVPDDNNQAEDRLHRLGQKKQVRAHYIMHKETLDEHVMDILNDKKAGANIILKPEHLLPARYRK